MQQCRSTTIYVLAKPELRVDPPSATLYRGESLRIRCISPSRDQRYGKLGYSWTKNNALFQLDSEIEMWEDLYPEGSILKINNIQVIYTHFFRFIVYVCVWFVVHFDYNKWSENGKSAHKKSEEKKNGFEETTH